MFRRGSSTGARGPVPTPAASAPERHICSVEVEHEGDRETTPPGHAQPRALGLDTLPARYEAALRAVREHTTTSTSSAQRPLPEHVVLIAE